MESIRRDHPLRRLFAGLVEHAFCEKLGVCDPRLTDYVAGLLVDFTHVDRLTAIRNAQGKDLTQIAAMLSVMSEDRPLSGSERDRSVYQSIGDYTLFWAGLFPEQLKRTAKKSSDILVDYVSQGKRCYAIVSELAGEDDVPPSSMFRHLSDDFEFCLFGLGQVRRGWERQPPERGGGGLGILY